MKLFNHDTGQYEEVASIDASPLLAAGTHTPQQGAKLKMLDPKTSSEVDVDANVANEYARMGFLALDPQAPTSTLLEDVQGLGYGVAQGLTLGTAGAIGTKLGIVEPETIQHLEEITPESIIAGELLSFAVPGLGELGAGRAAGRAIGAAQRAPRLAGDLLVKAVEKGVGELGERGVKGAIKKAIPSAIEGGAWSLGQQLTDDVVHDREFSAEEWAKQGLLGAGLGGAFGAVVEFGGPAALRSVGGGVGKLKDIARGSFKDIDELTNSQRKLRAKIDSLRQPFSQEGQELRANILDRTYEDRKRDAAKSLKEHISTNEDALGSVKSVIAEDTLENKQLVESLGGKIDFVPGLGGKKTMVAIIPAKRGDVDVIEILHGISGDVVVDNGINPKFADIIWDAGTVSARNNSNDIITLAKKLNIEDGFDILQFKGKLSANLQKRGIKQNLARALSDDVAGRLMTKLGAVDADGFPIDTDKLAHDLTWAMEHFNETAMLENDLRRVVGEDTFKLLKTAKAPMQGSDEAFNKKLEDIIEDELKKESSSNGNLFADIENITDRTSELVERIEKQRREGWRGFGGDVSSDQWQFNRTPFTGQPIKVPGMKDIKPTDISNQSADLNRLNKSVVGEDALEAMRIRQTLDAAGEDASQGATLGGVLGGIAGATLGHPFVGAGIGGTIGSGILKGSIRAGLSGAHVAPGILHTLRDPLGPARILYTLEQLGVKRDAALLKAIDDVLEGRPVDKARGATLMLLTRPSTGETDEQARQRFISDIEKIRENPEVLESSISPYVRRAAPRATALRLQTTLTAVEELMKHIPRANEGAVLSSMASSVNQTRLRDFNRKRDFLAQPELLLEHPLASRDDVAMVERVFPREIERMRQNITIAIQQRGDSLVDEAKRRNAQRLAFLFRIPGMPDSKPFNMANEQSERPSAGNIRGQVSTKSLMPSEVMQLPASDNPLKGSIPEMTPSQVLQKRAEGANF